MKAILILAALASIVAAQDSSNIPSDYALPYEHPYTKDGHHQKQVFRQSTAEPNVVLVTRYYWVDAQVPYYQTRETARWDRNEALKFVAQQRAQERAYIENQVELRRQQIAATEQRKRDDANAAKIGAAVEGAVESALQRERANTKRAIESALERDRAMRGN